MHRMIAFTVIAAVICGCNSGGGGSSSGGANQPAAANAVNTYQSTQHEQFVALQAHRFDAKPAWPLCGRISEAPPAGWQPLDGCPSSRWGSAKHTDLPLVGSFGPRLKATDNYRYDWHRGIDMKTPAGSPVFAITAGRVMIAGHAPMYTDQLVQLRHNRPGASSCYDGCYYSNYSHLSATVVSAGETVSKGQLIGYSGTNEAGYEHLHFELREVPNSSTAPWQRFAIHPLNMLAYDNCNASNMQVSINEFDTSNPLQPKVTVALSQPGSDLRVQVRKVQIEILEQGLDGVYRQIDQPDEAPTNSGYFRFPSWLDIDLRNRQYTHMDSPGSPWESFDNCPFAGSHGPAYAPNVHLDQTHPVQTRHGHFNGITLAPEAYEHGSDYELAVRFNELNGGLDATRLCAVAHVWLFDGRVIQDSVGCDWRTASVVCDDNCQALRDTQQTRRCGD